MRAEGSRVCFCFVLLVTGASMRVYHACTCVRIFIARLCVWLSSLQVIFLSMVCPVLFGFRSFMAFKGATPPLHPLHALPGAVTPPQVRAGQVRGLR